MFLSSFTFFTSWQENEQCNHFLQLKYPNNAQRRANDPENCAQLNAASAYFDAGLIQLEKTGTFHFMSTRDNAFTNRGVKATLRIQENWLLVAVATALAVILGTIALSSALYCRKLPQHIENNPEGCCAKSCCGRMIMRKHQADIDAKSSEKRGFLKKVDLMRQSKLNMKTIGDEEKNAFIKSTSDNDDDEFGATTKSTPSCCQRCCCVCSALCSCWSKRSQRNKVLLVLLTINIMFAALGFFRALVERPYVLCTLSFIC